MRKKIKRLKAEVTLHFQMSGVNATEKELRQYISDALRGDDNRFEYSISPNSKFIKITKEK